MRSGFRVGLPAALAMIPLGTALGAVIVHAGLAWWWAPIFGSVIYAGSLEFLLVSLVTAVAPLSQIAVSAFLVNFRHVFYSFSFPLYKVKKSAKPYSTFALTDEAYAVIVSSNNANMQHRQILMIQVLLQSFWVASVTAGAGLGNLIPPEVEGLEFAMTALFVCLAMDAYRQFRSVPMPLLALTCVAVALLLTPGAVLLTAMLLYVVTLSVFYVFSTRKGAEAS